jgi:transposase
MENKRRKKFNQEFIDSAVKLVESSGKTAAEVAREMGLPEWQVQTWVRKAKTRTTNGGTQEALLQENRRLKRELARAQEEAAILKKAAAYFAQHQQ